MLTLFLVTAAVLTTLLVGSLVAIPVLALAAVVWLVTLPLRLLFKMIAGIGGLLLGALVAPVLLLVVVVALVAALVAAVAALVAPLLPIAIVALLGWALYRMVSGRPDLPPSASGVRS